MNDFHFFLLFFHLTIDSRNFESSFLRRKYYHNFNFDILTFNIIHNIDKTIHIFLYSSFIFIFILSRKSFNVLKFCILCWMCKFSYFSYLWYGVWFFLSKIYSYRVYIYKLGHSMYMQYIFFIERFFFVKWDGRKYLLV